MSEPVIRVNNLSKAYPLYESPGDMLKELLFSRQQHNKFWALKDISFELPEKSRVGIIGPNGSGKSTLLQIITGNLQPTSGSVEVNGEISGMLSLNSVLNPEETGLSNIRFNLLLNGCSPDSLQSLTEEIVEFTELGQFIYSPVRTYSSGMNARLAFGIATAIEPEILIVDEVLSVGDAYFVGKATQRMVELCDRGKALVFVSHAIADVQRLCDKVIWMENGVIRNMGPSDYIIKLYEEDYRRREDEAIREKNRERSQEQSIQGISDYDPEEFATFRLVTSSGQAFSDTYYLRTIAYQNTDVHAHRVNVDLLTDPALGDARLEKFSSEWGRAFEWEGINCRMLEARTGRNHGGHFSIPVSSSACEKFPVSISACYRSHAAGEALAVEFFDNAAAKWVRAELLEETVDETGWRSLVANANYPIATAKQIEASVRLVEERAKPQVEILEVDVVSEGESTRVLLERQPFQVSVSICANRHTDVCDVHLKIMRSDGVYVFWQSSGMTGNNLEMFAGKSTVYFDFSPNCLGEGEYHLTFATTNGWDYPENYPHSECFDRKVAALQFKIQREMPGLDLGVFNARVPTRVDHED